MKENSVRTGQLQSLIAKLRSEIVERKAAEEALRKNEALLRSLFESAPDATVLVNEKGMLLRINAQAEAMFGYKSAELIGKSVAVLLPERFQNQHSNLRNDYLVDPHTRTMAAGQELYARRKDGSELPVEVVLSPVQTEEGTLILGSLRDITERKQMEAELAEVQRRLIDSVEYERIHLAQELHDGPIQELYGVSYQLKGIHESLAEIEQAMTGRIELSDTEKTVQSVIDSIRSICENLRPPALVPFGLEKAIRSHAERLSASHPDLEIYIELDADEQLLPEQVRLALYRIYQNATSNVIRHAQAHRLEICFKLNENNVVLEIRDDGCGFKLPEKWVELARRGHLGLVGILERTRAIGGQLKVITAPGEGTLIQVAVPRGSTNPSSFA